MLLPSTLKLVTTTKGPARATKEGTIATTMKKTTKRRGRHGYNVKSMMNNEFSGLQIQQSTVQDGVDIDNREHRGLLPLLLLSSTVYTTQETSKRMRRLLSVFKYCERVHPSCIGQRILYSS